jgi:16S rRNA (adenine1518-N6/adenine1519-N6)-dimethyltransferase
MNTHRPRKRFGQHFLTDPGVIDEILRAIAPQTSDVIVEIGPGPGAITAPIAKRCGHLHAVELDRDLAARLRLQYSGNESVSIHEADALGFDYAALGADLRVIGNLPYNISTPLLFHLLRFRHSISDMHFMLQKEVVERMAAGPGSKKYGRLSIMLGCYLDIERLFDVDRLAFEPPPEVTSAVVRLRPLAGGARDIADPDLMSRVVASAFSQRRKTLRNALKGIASDADFDAVQIDAGQRPENIAVDDWIALTERLATNTDNSG